MHKRSFVRLTRHGALAFVIFFGGFLVSLGVVGDAHAESGVTFIVTVNDEFGDRLYGGAPSFQFDACDVQKVEVPTAKGNGEFHIPVTFDGTDKNCVVRAHHSFYLSSAARETGVPYGTEHRVSLPLTLSFPLKATVTDDLGVPITNAILHHNGFSPSRVESNAYYFATRDAGEVTLDIPGFGGEDGKAQHTLLKVPTGGSSRTTIQFKGATPCTVAVSAGAEITCRAPRPAVVIRTVTPTGVALSDAIVRIFTDETRETPADDLRAGVGTAQLFTDTTGARFALPAGKYFVKAERTGYNHAHHIFSLTHGSRYEHTVVFEVEGSLRVSQRRSDVLIFNEEAPADGASSAAVLLRIRDGAGTNYARVGVVIASNRTEDTIENAGTTDATGRLQFYVRSREPGSSVITIRAGGVMLSIFPKITFTTPSVWLTEQAPSPKESSVTSTQTPVRADGKDPVTVTVTVRNRGKAALKGEQVTLGSSRSGFDAIIPASAETDGEGKAVFTVTSREMGTSMLTATVQGVAVGVPLAISVSPVVE